jgi:hypothetical protein
VTAIISISLYWLLVGSLVWCFLGGPDFCAWQWAKRVHARDKAPLLRVSLAAGAMIVLWPWTVWAAARKCARQVRAR